MAEAGATPGTSREITEATPGTSREITEATPGTSRGITTAIPGTSRRITAAIQGTSRERTATILGTSREITAAIPGTSRERTAAIPGTSRGITAAIPGTSRRITEAIPGTSRKITAAIPGTSRGIRTPEIPEDIDKEFGALHHIVIQGLMSAGHLDGEGVKMLFTKACSHLHLNPEPRTTTSYIQRIVVEINEQISLFDMAIRSCTCEQSGIKYYIFLISVGNPILKVQTYYTEFQMKLFAKILDTILRKSYTFSVALIECMNMSKEIEGHGSLEEAEQFLLRMIDMKYLSKYFVKNAEWEVTLGFVAIHEFEAILRNCYSDVMAKCTLCKRLLLHGLVCPDCKVSVHKACYTKFVKTGKQCPNCESSVWGNGTALLPRVQEDVGDDEQPSSSQPEPDTPDTNVASAEPMEESDLEDLEMPVLEPAVGHSSCSRSRKSSSSPYLSSDAASEQPHTRHTSKAVRLPNRMRRQFRKPTGRRASTSAGKSNSDSSSN